MLSCLFALCLKGSRTCGKCSSNETCSMAFVLLFFFCNFIFCTGGDKGAKGIMERKKEDKTVFPL
jgi:hypothetical protein